MPAQGAMMNRESYDGRELQSLFNKMIARQNDCFVVLVRASALAKMIVRQND